MNEQGGTVAQWLDLLPLSKMNSDSPPGSGSLCVSLVLWFHSSVQKHHDGFSDSNLSLLGDVCLYVSL